VLRIVVQFVLDLHGDDRTGRRAQRADLPAEVAEVSLHIGQVAGGVGACRFVLGDKPVRVAAVANLPMAPWPDSRNRRKPLGLAQALECAEVAIAREVWLSVWHGLMMVPEHVRRNHVHRAGPK
jgi:hypothetical protein